MMPHTHCIPGTRFASLGFEIDDPSHTLHLWDASSPSLAATANNTSSIASVPTGIGEGSNDEKLSTKEGKTDGGKCICAELRQRMNWLGEQGK